MAIHDNDGTRNHEIKKVLDNDGSVSREIRQVLDNDGTANHLVFTSSVTLRNLISSEQKQSRGWSDIGYDRQTITIVTVGLKANHRYFLRWGMDGFHAGGDVNQSIKVNGVELGRRSVPGDGSTSYVYGNYIFNPGSKTSMPIEMWFDRNNSSQGGVGGTCYMVVDLTEEESMKGSQYTADAFWSAVGSVAFYGTKELQL